MLWREPVNKLGLSCCEYFKGLKSTKKGATNKVLNKIIKKAIKKG